MTSLLRSSKFIKFFTGLTRNLALNSFRSDGFALVENRHFLNTTIRYLATQNIAFRTQNESNLEKSLRRLDMDARRAGRITLKELEEVLEEMKLSRSATSTQSLLVIRCCGNLVPEEHPEVRTKLVTEIWKTIESLGIPLDISHYNALLRVYLENHHDFSPAEFLKELEVKGIEPNRVTYQRLIARYCQSGDIEGATQILQHMKEKQLPVNEGVFNSLVMGHSQSGDMESARGILVVMEQAGLKPSAETYATLMCGYAKTGDIDAIKNTLKVCESKEIDMLDRDLMDILYVSMMNGHPEFVDELLNRMRRVGGYNQDAINLILKLINNGQEESAYKVLLTMPRPVRTDGEQIPVGNFFIRQLVKAERPLDKIMFYCNELQKNDLNPRAHLVALESCLTLSKTPEVAYAMMESLNNMGYAPRPHFFWPLLAFLGSKGDIEGNLSVIRKMFEMKVTPGAETLKDYVVPHLVDKELKAKKGFDSESVISTLRGCGVSVASAANALVIHLVTTQKLKEAAEIARRYRARYASMALQKPMAIALVNSEDVNSYVTILAQMCAGIASRSQQVEEEPEDEVVVDESIDHTEGVNNSIIRKIVGSYVVDVLFTCRSNKGELMTSLLNSLLDQGLGITNTHAEILQERLGSDLTPEISSILSKLTSDNLIPRAPQMNEDFRPPVLEGKDLENLLATQEAKGNPTRGIKRQLLSYYCRNKNLEGATKLLEELKADKEFIFTDGQYVLLMDLYASIGKLDEALEYRNKVLEKDSGATIEDYKILKLTEALISANRFDEAMKVINEQPPDRKVEPRSFGYTALCWRILNSLAEDGKVEEIEKFFDALVKNNFVEPTNVLMGPLIRVYLEKNDIENAMKKFEWCCETYGATPFKNQLSCKLIEAEDAVSLQRLTDLSTRIHGEVNSLYDLVFSFVECGRVRQARKILETPGLRNRPQRLNSACQRYSDEGLAAPLEGLVEATKDLHHIDRSDIYLYLLKSYCKTNDANKALGLWTQMQDEDVQPSDEFLISLASLLRENNLSVPFVEPMPLAPLSVSGQGVKILPERIQQQQNVDQNLLKTPTMQRFRQAIRLGDIDAALQCKARFESEGRKLPVTELSLLVEQLVKNDRLGEATSITENYLAPDVRQNGRLISPRVLRFLLNRLANLGDINSFTNIGNLLSQDEKRLLSFDNRMCNAYMVSGKAEEYLKNLEDQIEKAKEEDLEIIQETFPRGGAFGILKNQPDLVPLYEAVAKKYAARKIVSPINILWGHYFSTKGKESEAEAIWKEHLQNSSRVMFQFVCQTARANKDAELAQKLVNVIKESPVTDGAKGNVHGCFIDILVNEQKVDEGLKALNEALKDVSLESISRGALFRLKNAVELQGKAFPYTIPEKNTKESSSSSSSSDDEPPSKKK